MDELGEPEDVPTPTQTMGTAYSPPITSTIDVITHYTSLAVLLLFIALGLKLVWMISKYDTDQQFIDAAKAKLRNPNSGTQND